MSTELISIGPTLGFVILALIAIAVVVAIAGGLTRPWSIPWAAVRGTVQLAILAIVLSFVVGHGWATGLFLIVISATASWTAAGRINSAQVTEVEAMHGTIIRPAHSRLRLMFYAFVPVALAPLALTGALLLIGVLPLKGLAIIPTAGILIGNSMNVVSLTAARVHDQIGQRWGEVEAALALGCRMYQSRMLVGIAGSHDAIIPAIDSAKTVGLVTIPGAFVGMVLGGASITAAAIMQLFIVIGILCMAVIGNVVTTRLIALDRL